MIDLFKVHMPKTVSIPLLDSLHSGFIGQGEKVDEFEKALQRWTGNPYTLVVNNGTSALTLALKLAGVERGSLVISTPMTCMASNTPIVNLGASIIWADVNPKTGLICPDSIERLMANKTHDNPFLPKAIMCVDWAGCPCDYDEINDIGKKYGIPIIADAAHSIGSCYKGRITGSIVDFTCFSLQAIKHITTIEGGILTCKDKADYEKAKLLRWYGIDRSGKTRDYRITTDVPDAGYKMNMVDPLAVIGIEQLKYVKDVLFKYWGNADYYNKEFKKRNIGQIEPISRYYKEDRLSSHWIYGLWVKNSRDEFVDYMNDKGIGCNRVHVRNDKKSCFKAFTKHDLPGVTAFDNHQVNIPCHYALTHQERKYIMDCIEQF